MSTTLTTLVDDWLESKVDDERPARPGYDRGLKLPRPKLNEYRIGFYCEALGTGGHRFRVTAIGDDFEPIVGPKGEYVSEAIDAAIGRTIHNLLLAIDSDAHEIIDSYESAYHMSDEAMRATHPREL